MKQSYDNGTHWLTRLDPGDPRPEQFIKRYCQTRGDNRPRNLGNTVWYGVSRESGTHAILGLATQEGVGTVVTGLFADPTREGVAATHAAIRLVHDSISRQVSWIILLKNKPMLKRVMKYFPEVEPVVLFTKKAVDF